MSAAGPRRAEVALAMALPLLVVGPTQAALSLTEGTTSHHLALSSIPIKLAVGPQGNNGDITTTVSVNRTGSHITQEEDTGKYQALYVNNTSSTPLRVRLVLVSTVNQANWLKGHVYLKNQSSGAENRHIDITSGSIVKSVGPWENIAPAGSAGSEYRLSVDPENSGSSEPTMTYRLEYVPRNALSPSVHYFNMTFHSHN